jgi:hypothetical protein
MKINEIKIKTITGVIRGSGKFSKKKYPNI